MKLGLDWDSKGAQGRAPGRQQRFTVTHKAAPGGAQA